MNCELVAFDLEMSGAFCFDMVTLEHVPHLGRTLHVCIRSLVSPVMVDIYIDYCVQSQTGCNYYGINYFRILTIIADAPDIPLYK